MHEKMSDAQLVTANLDSFAIINLSPLALRRCLGKRSSNMMHKQIAVVGHSQGSSRVATKL
jgi:hypothetical protein